jgi:hypothetical protein
MDRIRFRGRPKIVDLSTSRRVADRVEEAAIQVCPPVCLSVRPSRPLPAGWLGAGGRVSRQGPDKGWPRCCMPLHAAQLAVGKESNARLCARVRAVHGG